MLEIFILTGKEIKARLKEYNMTQADLAKELEVTLPTVNAAILDKVGSRMVTKMAMSHYFHMKDGKEIERILTENAKLKADNECLLGNRKQVEISHDRIVAELKRTIEVKNYIIKNLENSLDIFYETWEKVNADDAKSKIENTYKIEPVPDKNGLYKVIRKDNGDDNDKGDKDGK